MQALARGTFICVSGCDESAWIFSTSGAAGVAKTGSSQITAVWMETDQERDRILP